jgi:hypothetical protein
MGKSYIFFSLIFIISACLITCRNFDNPVSSRNNSSGSGSIVIASNPSGAQIFQGNFFTNKTTPDSITNLNPGYVNFTLKLFNYKDTTFSAFLEPGKTKYYNINLTFNTELAIYGNKEPVLIWELYNSPPTVPNGLILSTGRAVSINNDSLDVFYYSKSTGPFELRSADLNGELSRHTYFRMGSSENIDDHIPAPEKDSSWTRKIDFAFSNGSTIESHYFFMYDQNGHYSKVKIYIGGGRSTGDKSDYAAFTWYYNRIAGDRNF